MPPGFPCAELLPCAVLHDLYGSAEQDLTGLLKALPYGIPETLHSPYRHTQTLNCYSCYCDYHYHRCYPYAIIFTVHDSYRCATQKQKCLVYLGGPLSPHFRGTVCVPLDFLLLLYFHVFSGLSVLLFSVYVQLRQNVPCPTQKWCSAITSS